MAELNPKRHKKDTDDQDTFQEVSIPFAFPKENENNHEKEEFKEVSVHLRVNEPTDSAQSLRPNMKRTKPSSSKEKEKTITCTPTASETGIETYQAETDDD